MSFELNGQKLADTCFFGLPYASWMLPRAGRTLDLLVELTILATENLHEKSFTTTTYLDKGNGLKKSTATVF